MLFVFNLTVCLCPHILTMEYNSSVIDVLISGQFAFHIHMYIMSTQVLEQLYTVCVYRLVTTSLFVFHIFIVHS